MNTKDLIIGDLLSSEYGDVVMVRAIDDSPKNPKITGEIITGVEEGEIYDIDLQCGGLSDIPLTPEFLEKNGFKDQSGFNRQFAVYGPYEITALYLDEDHVSCQINNHCGAILSAIITTVRQFQHMVNLAGLKKDLEL